MEYELKFKYAAEAAAAFLIDEDTIRRTAFNESIYAHGGVGESLYRFSYDRLWDENFRKKWLEIINHESRKEMMPRIYGKCLAVAAFTGNKFIEDLTETLVGCIAGNAAKQNKKALESCKTTLGQFFKDNACLWFCVILYDVFIHNQIKHLAKMSTAASTRTAAAMMQ